MKYSSISRGGALKRMCGPTSSIAATTAGSMSKPSRSASTTARSMRTGSSWKRSTGSPIERMTRVFEVLQAADVVDDRAVGRVVEQRVDGEVAAERVFLGRAVDVVALDEEVGLAFGGGVGLVGRTLRRNVATSIVLGPNLTWARRNRRPMIQQFRKPRLIWWGWADVPMSKSLGRRPRSRSLTLPPTRNAVWPSSWSRLMTLSASESTSRLERVCSERGRTMGSTIVREL